MQYVVAVLVVILAGCAPLIEQSYYDGALTGCHLAIHRAFAVQQPGQRDIVADTSSLGMTEAEFCDGIVAELRGSRAHE